jgi:RNA polymerase sigma-70 factor (ECF subfamily)
VSADDQRLLADSRRGNLQAFGELVRRYQDRLFNTVYRLLDNTEDAQDVVQEAFLSAFQALKSFKGQAQFYTWLYRIAVNSAISLKRKKRVGLSIHIGPGETFAFEPLDPSEANRPDFSLERQEEEQRVQDALNRLSPEHRAVLILKDIQGEKYETMAAILSVPVGTIRSRLHRARMEMRELLEQEERHKEKG